METRLLAPIGAFDQNGVFGIGLHLPWGDENGRSLLREDMGRFVHVTKERVFEDGMKNVLVVGRNTAESFGWRPLPKRHLIILSQTLDEKTLNTGREDSKKMYVVRNTRQAIERALELPDCGHIFFAGGEQVWLEALDTGLCNSAFITEVKCDSLALTTHRGEPRRMPHMLAHETYKGMSVESVPLWDMWGDQEVHLEFRNYKKI